MRLILVWSSLSPVFLLWALRGVEAVSDWIWAPVCLGLFVAPTLILHFFLKRARSQDNSQSVKIVSVKDQKEHLLTYLFAMLIPLFDVNLGGTRDLLAVSAAFLFIIFLFWHMRLHYMNIFFAFEGYRIYTIEAKFGTTGKDKQSEILKTYAVLSKRHHIPPGELLTGIRLGGDVLVDKDEND